MDLREFCYSWLCCSAISVWSIAWYIGMGTVDGVSGYLRVYSLWSIVSLLDFFVTELPLRADLCVLCLLFMHTAVFFVCY